MRIFDNRRRKHFSIDDEYVDFYARHCGRNATAVYTSLCRHVNKQQKCFPSIDLIAEQHDMGRDSVIAGIKALEKWGIIQVVRERGERGNYKANSYFLIDKSEWKSLPGQVEKIDSAKETAQVGNSDTVEQTPKSEISTPPSRDSQATQVVNSDYKDTQGKDTQYEGTPIFPKGEKEILETKLDDLVKPYEGKYSPLMIADFKDKYDANVYYHGKLMKLWQKLALKPDGAFDTGKRLSTWKRLGDKFDYRDQEARRRAWEAKQGEDKPRRSYEGQHAEFSSFGEIAKRFNS